MPSTTTGRLAPTPSGHLHLGNVCAFAACWLSARQAQGRVLLRIEDIDQGRARSHIAESQREDLDWLELSWDDEVPCQSTRNYAPWLRALGDRVYTCACTRRQRRHGTCQCRTNQSSAPGTLRFALSAQSVHFVDERFGPRVVDLSTLDDPVLQRSDGTMAYNLAVVADDITDGVTEVVRGADLLDLTAAQIDLWRALRATPPRWLHAPLVLGPDGRKLSKSHASLEVRALRDAGWSPRDVWRLSLPWLGLPSGCDALSDAIASFEAARGPRGPIHLKHGADTPRPNEITWSTEV